MPDDDGVVVVSIGTTNEPANPRSTSPDSSSICWSIVSGVKIPSLSIDTLAKFRIDAAYSADDS